VNGLHITRFSESGIWIVGDGGGPAQNNTITNNEVDHINSHVQAGLAGIRIVRNAPNNTISNNYVHDTADNGINVQSDAYGDGNTNNTLVSGNFVYNTCTGSQDCGQIATQDFQLPPSTGMIIRNNYVRDSAVGRTGNGYTGGVGIYLDDGASNWTVSGNVITGAQDFCVQLHGGKHNTITGNIC